MIFFGFGSFKFLPIFLLLFFLTPVFLYSPGFALLLGGILLLVFLVGSAARRRGRARETDWAEEPEPPTRPFAEVRSAAQDDLLALADDIRALDLDIELPGADPEAKRHYERALDHYEASRAAFDAAERPEDFEPVSHAVEQGRFEIASAQARLDGRELPERRPPCFFDPRHGPSVRDVEWAPPGGASRPVPACAADAIRIEEGQNPESRQVLVGGRPVDYWNAPAYYGPWAGGFFGGAGGLLPGLLVGSALGVGLSSLGPFGLDDESVGGGDFEGFE